jgi:hypothetical protein
VADKEDSMKRFLVFYGDDYYPMGGAEDLAGDFDTREAAITSAKEAQKEHGGWAHVLDTETGKMEEL